MNVVTVRAKRLCAMWMAVFMLLFSVPVPVVMATEPVGGGTSETTVTLAFKDDAQWNNNATLGDYYSVNIIASSDAGDSFPMCATQVYIRFDPNVLTFVSAQLRNKIAAFQVPDPEDLSGGTMSVDVSSNTLTEKLQEGYIGFTHFKPASLGQSYNTVVNNGQTIATLNFQPANDAARSQTAQLSFVSATGTTSQVGFFENLSSTSSTQYTLSLGAPHTVPALNAPVNTHTVTVTNGTGGGDYAENASVTITANDAPTGQRFKEWTGADSLTFTQGSKTTTPATFTMPAEAVSVTATYEDIPPVTYPVTVNNGTGGGDYAANATVTITANDPAPGQRFKEWTGADSLTFDRTTTPATFTMPAGAVSVTATYEDIPPVTYPVTVNNGTGGGNYAENASVTITANDAPTGQRFKEWTGADSLTFTQGSKTTTPATFTMPAGAVSVTATYEPITHTVTVDGGTGSGTYAVGNPVTIAAGTAPTGRQFSGWTGTDSLNFDRTVSPATFAMPDYDVTLTANYEPIMVTVTLNPGEGSNGTARTDTLAMGSTYTLPPANTFAPKSDRYIFRAWRVGDAERLPDQTITLSANIEITAQWDELVTVTLNPGAGSNDTARTETRVKGSTYTLPSADTFRAIDGYTFRNWKVGDEAKSPNETIVLNADTVITAEWNEPTPQVTVTWNPGTGSDDAARTESRDKDSTFALPGNFFRPRSNLYSFKDWLVNGVAMQPGATITLSANTVIMAEWNEPELYTVTVSNGEGGGQYQQGETVRITAAPSRGESSFTVWTWTGPENFAISDIMSTDTTFIMPAGDVSVTANYGGCYVATAVYGSYDCPEVWTLRRFRDQVLAKTWYGRLFIHLYYAVSPTAVRLFGQTSLFQNFFRSILDPWVANLQSDGFESTPYNDMPW